MNFIHIKSVEMDNTHLFKSTLMKAPENSEN